MSSRRRAGEPARGDEAIARGENRGLIRRYYEELWNEWNLALADEIISPEITFRGSLAVTVRGLDGFKSYVALVRNAFPDFHNTIEELVAEGDRVAARLTYRGELFGIAPTSIAVTYAGAAIFRIRSKKIVDGWVLGDTAALMRQLAAAPAHGGGGSPGSGAAGAGAPPAGSPPGPR
jgi:predicted ester cyclase